MAEVLKNENDNITEKTIQLIAKYAIPDHSIISLLNHSRTLPCDDDRSKEKQQKALLATTAATTYIMPLQANPDIALVEIVGQIAFSANFSGTLVRQQVQLWINDTYYSRIIGLVPTVGKTSQRKGLSRIAIASITVSTVLIVLILLAGVPLFVYRRKIFQSSLKFVVTQRETSQLQQQAALGNGVFSAFANPTHGYGSARQQPKSRQGPHYAPGVTELTPPSSSSSSSRCSEDGSPSPKSVTGNKPVGGTNNDTFHAF